MAAEVIAASEDGSLSDEQIEQLLQQAEARLSESAGGALSLRRGPAYHIPKAPESDLPKPYVKSNDAVARIEPGRLVGLKERESANSIRRVEDPIQSKKRKLADKKATAGPKWFNMPKTDLTPELKRDFQLLKMRNVLDPKRHYKKDNKSGAPEFSQRGTVVEGATEFFSGRLQNSERKRTLAEEILAGEQESGRFKRKYNEIQDSKRSGKKGHYKAMSDKRFKKNVKR